MCRGYARNIPLEGSKRASSSLPLAQIKDRSQPPLRGGRARSRMYLLATFPNQNIDCIVAAKVAITRHVHGLRNISKLPGTRAFAIVRHPRGTRSPILVLSVRYLPRLRRASDVVSTVDVNTLFEFKGRPTKLHLLRAFGVQVGMA